MIRTDAVVDPDGEVVEAGIFAAASWCGRDPDNPDTEQTWRVKAYSICVHDDRSGDRTGRR